MVLSGGLGEIVTFDEACFGESLAHPIDHEPGPRRPGVPEKPDHRHRALLRTRRERPGAYGAAKKSDEFASPHGFALRPKTAP
jgi:hypothetical protein